MALEHPMSYRWTMEDLERVKATTKAEGTRALAKLNALYAPRAPKRPKYGNTKVTDDAGNVHDSTKEFRRWQELQLRERAGEISLLRRQVPFALVVNGALVCQYIADFVYRDGAAEICEDVKSPATRKLPAYAIKKKLMKALHHIEIREI